MLLPLSLSLLLPPKDILTLRLLLFHGWHPHQVKFHLQQQMPHMKSYPSPTSTSVSPCSFHSKYPVFCSQHLACNPSAHGVIDRGCSSHLISHTILWRFHPITVFLRAITFPLYGYWSFQCGHWPTTTITTTPSYSSLPALDGAVLKNRFMTTDDRNLYLLSLPFLCQGVWCNFTDTLKTTYHAVMRIRNAWLKLEPPLKKIIISHLVVSGNLFLCSSEFILLLDRPSCPDGMHIVGRGCYTPCTEATETLEYVPY